jgi:hypothetical protein
MAEQIIFGDTRVQLLEKFRGILNSPKDGGQPNIRAGGPVGK